MKIVSPEQMREIDNTAINRFGIPGIVLMENAALKVVEEIVKIMGDIKSKSILLFAGKGNNGGDAFAVARHVYNRGANVKLYVTSMKNGITGDARTNMDILENMQLEVHELAGDKVPDELKFEIQKASLIVDGMFGTGLRGEISGIAGEVINLINESGKTIVSIDIPSGVNGGTGQIPGMCVKATRTVTFCLPKTGLLLHPGCEYTGDLIVADIGIPRVLVDRMDIRMNMIDAEMVSKLLPVRKKQSNKGDYGKILIISGSVGMTGAGYLCGKAALRSGAGLVYLGVPSSLLHIYDNLLAESITVPLDDNASGYLSKTSIKQLGEKIKNKDVIAIGPGLSVNQDIIDIVSYVIENSEVPVVLDADALNALSADVSVLKKLKAKAVITPHPGEMSRLAGISINDVQNNRVGVAREFACKWGVTTVLKGAKTIVAVPDGTVYINPTGNSGMATGGTGDVLTGIIAALAGQGILPEDSAVAGVYLHGLSGDCAAAAKGQYGLIASDIIEELPYAINRVMG